MENTIREIDRTSPEEVLLEKELLNALEEVIQLLPDQCQLVFRMAREENMSYQEISDRLGIHVSTVKSHMIKAIADVRNHISSKYDEEQDNSSNPTRTGKANTTQTTTQYTHITAFTKTTCVNQQQHNKAVPGNAKRMKGVQN